jgi:hypothetical protein
MPYAKIQPHQDRTRRKRQEQLLAGPAGRAGQIHRLALVLQPDAADHRGPLQNRGSAGSGCAGVAGEYGGLVLREEGALEQRASRT